jgi:cbb3-type cytochrome oxidase subunit 3
LRGSAVCQSERAAALPMTGIEGDEYGYIDYCNYWLYVSCSRRDTGSFRDDEKQEMTIQAIAYILFGLVLVMLFGIIIVFYYSKKRHKKVEEAKYKMMDDDD